MLPAKTPGAPADSKSRRRTRSLGTALPVALVAFVGAAAAGPAAASHAGQAIGPATVASETEGSGGRQSQSPTQTTWWANDTTDGADANPGDGRCATEAGLCTLRAAVQEANAAGTPATIRLPSGTYALTVPGAGEDVSASGDLDLRAPITLIGEGGRQQTIIESQVADRVVHVHGGTSATLRGLTLRNGDHVPYGAGVYNEGGTLVLEDCEVSDNHTELPPEVVAHPGLLGGGICNEGGAVSLIGTIVRANEAAIGGGIESEHGRAELLLVRSSVRDNRASIGGGIFVGVRGANAVAIVDSEVTGNQATDGAGGVFIASWEHAALHMIGSTIAGNQAFAGGGMILKGSGVISATIESSSIIDNLAPRDKGGGVLLDAWGCITLTMSNSLVARNQASQGAGLHATSLEELSLRLTNSTLSENVATSRGGALLVVNNEFDHPGLEMSRVALNHATLASNSAPLGSSIDAGYESVGTGHVLVKNSIIAGAGPGPDCVAEPPFLIASLGYNAGRDNSCGLTTLHDASGVDPLLGALASNGGPTLTNALLPGSPAIDWADSADCPASDQRGAPRPSGAGCDAGAFEYGASAPNVPEPWPVPPMPYVPLVPAPPLSENGYHCSWPPATPAAPSTEVPTATPRPLPTVAPPTTLPTSGPTSTALPSATPTAGATPTAPAQCVCPVVRRRVPAVVVADALANPQRYYGWRYPLDPGKPPSPANPPRECLSLRNVNIDYHPLWNAPVWRVGCP